MSVKPDHVIYATFQYLFWQLHLFPYKHTSTVEFDPRIKSNYIIILYISSAFPLCDIVYQMC